MRKFLFCVLGMAALFLSLGCRAEVKSTEDSNKLEIEVPKLEIGSEPVDTDVSTDKDVDIDTPAPGDK